MKTLPLAASLLLTILMTAPTRAQTTYELHVEESGRDLDWSDAASWIGGVPESYPNASTDDLLFPMHTAVHYLHVDQSELEVGTFTISGDLANAPRLIAKSGVDATLRIGTFKHLAPSSVDSSFQIANSDGTLSIVIGTLETSADTRLEIGHNGLQSLEGFEVTTSSHIAGRLHFSGIRNRAEGENRIQLGALHLEATGSVMLGYRHNNTGVLEVTSLTGTGNIYLSGNSNHLGDKGTVEIHSAASTTATFAGKLRTSDRSTLPAGAENFQLILRKKGAGTQILSSGDHDHRGGTFIEEGTLAITNTTGSGLGLGEVRVEEGGTLAGSGRLALEKSVLVEAGGRIAPSAHLATGVATLTLDGAGVEERPILKIAEGGAFSFRFGENDASDSIRFTNYGAGGFTLSSTNVYLHGENVQAGEFLLFTFDYIDSTELDSLAQAFIAGDGFAGYQATFSSSGNTLLLNVAAIPEPGTVALGMIGLAGLWVWRRFSSPFSI
ncbi:MAG TPA: autotransporter-associated beta strand repeat-containing protein [Chthoniobacteraceae bacterium]|nr:autotransporter-associated beta strand repeat-containing protein [Chthoniobacteraceae bacterium]